MWSAEGRRGPGVKQILMCRNEVGLQQGRVHRAGVGRHCPVERSCRVER